ncbi:hypothetical protein OO014_06165 [Intrasporangium calvum]|uniref:Uncharacterized protein n=1 Tax=Intrasporangium calvum TaxID=53358 RepID=A0ABT5GF06_9MICO|nr:hypothetical protein [Intrasporangium calvum]MDC5696837.1 hypothetical protein [Intrasporangium calvum]
MKQNEIRGHLVAEALAACPTLSKGTPEYDRLWRAVELGICTRGLCLVTPLGSSSSIAVTEDHAMVELLAAMEWLVAHAGEARALTPIELYIKLRGVATRGASGSARAAQADALHGLTNVSPGDPVIFVDSDSLEDAS